MRSELENEMLALELVNDRVRLKENLDKVCFGIHFSNSFLFYFNYLRLKIEWKQCQKN